MSNMVVATNVLALNSHRSMKLVGNDQAKASARLSSGYKINSAADDAAGLAISEKMRAQIRGLDMASKNAQDAISLIQTAEGGMQEIDNMVQRIRELVVYASNDTQENNDIGTGDRQKIQDEINQLVEEIDSMAERVEFNKKAVINGTYSNPVETLGSAQSKYATTYTNLQTALATLNAATTNRDTANADYTTVKNATNLYENTMAGLKTVLGNQLDALSTTTITASATTFASYDTAVNSTMVSFVSALSKIDPSEWTEASIQALAEKYFVTNDEGKNSFGTQLVDPSTTAATEYKAIETVGFSGTLKGGNFAITLGAVLQTGVAVPADATFGASGAGVSLAINNAYIAQLNIVNYDSNKAIVAPITQVGAFNATGNVYAALPDGTGTNVYANSTNKSNASLAGGITNSAELYATMTTVSLTKANADDEYGNALRSVDTLKQQLGVYTSQINSAMDSLANLNGKSPGLYFQVGANATQGIQASIGSVNTNYLGIGDGKGKSTIDVVENTGLDITNQLDILDEALSYVTTERSKLGAYQNRLEYTMKSLDISSENLSAAESRIRDADMAKEMMALTRTNVLQQAATSMLAQANQAPQNVLQLLR